MPESDTNYYVAAGRSLAAILEWKNLVEAKRKEWLAFKDKHGGKDIIFDTYSFGSEAVSGLRFDSCQPPSEGWEQKMPKGWRRPVKKDYYVPDKKTKEGRAIHNEMRKLTIPPPSDAVGKVEIIGLKMCSPGFAKVGDDWIIQTHLKCDAPSDGIPIKDSEYWRRVEASKEQKDEESVSQTTAGMRSL